MLFVLKVSINLTWSLANLDSPYISSLGLSGLVSGMIGFAAYAVPRARVRCLFGFIIYFWHGSLAIWLLALWFVGWGIYYLNSIGASSVNYLAHVVGALGGYILAVLFFRQRKAALQAEINNEISRYKLVRIDRTGRA